MSKKDTLRVIKEAALVLYPLTNLEMRILHAGTWLGILLEQEKLQKDRWKRDATEMVPPLNLQTEAAKVLKHTVLLQAVTGACRFQDTRV